MSYFTTTASFTLVLLITIYNYITHIILLIELTIPLITSRNFNPFHFLSIITIQSTQYAEDNRTNIISMCSYTSLRNEPAMIVLNTRLPTFLDAHAIFDIRNRNRDEGKKPASATSDNRSKRVQYLRIYGGPRVTTQSGRVFTQQ